MPMKYILLNLHLSMSSSDGSLMARRDLILSCKLSPSDQTLRFNLSGVSDVNLIQYI